MIQRKVLKKKLGVNFTLDDLQDLKFDFTEQNGRDANRVELNLDTVNRLLQSTRLSFYNLRPSDALSQYLNCEVVIDSDLPKGTVYMVRELTL